MFTNSPLTFLQISAMVNWTYLFQLFAILSIIFAVLILISKIVFPQADRIADVTPTHIDNILFDVINSLNLPFYFILALFISLEFAPPPTSWQNILHPILMIIFAFYGTRGLSQLVSEGFQRFIEKKQEQKQKVDQSVLIIMRTVSQILIWIVAGILVLENLGYSVSTLIGGLGVAGIAVAFGVKSLLEDVLSFISISFDKPFTVGDYIVVDDDSGTVQEIGLRSTRLKTLSGEELIISNRELIESRIKNYRRMQKRGDTFQIQINLNTPLRKLKKVKPIIEDIIKKQENTEISRVYFKQIGDNGYVFDITYYILSGEYEVLASNKEAINFSILENLEQEDIELAMPEQVILVKKK